MHTASPKMDAPSKIVLYFSLILFVLVDFYLGKRIGFVDRGRHAASEGAEPFCYHMHMPQGGGG